MIEIRPYKQGDDEDIKNLIKDFHEEALKSDGFQLDVEKYYAPWIALLKDSVFVAVKDNNVIGVLGGNIIRHHFSNELVFIEMMWYVRPEHRMCGIRLFKYVEEWCRIKGIKKMVMVYTHNIMTEKLNDFYKRMGFRPLETHMLKEL